MPELPVPELLCPRCETALLSFSVFEASLHRCDGCDGMWVPSKFVEALAKKPELRARLDPMAKRVAGDKPRPQPASFARPAPCAMCRVTMQRFELGQISQVTVDACREHGTWFDKDELGRVVAFLKANPNAPVQPPAPPARPAKGKAKAPERRAKLHPPRTRTSSSSSSGDSDGAEVVVGVVGFLLELFL